MLQICQIASDFKFAKHNKKQCSLEVLQQMSTIAFVPGFRVDCLPEFDNMTQVSKGNQSDNSHYYCQTRPITIRQ